MIENEAGVGFINQPIRGEVTVFKTDKVTGDKLVGAGFRVFDADGNVVDEAYTGDDGTVTFSLRYGNYTVAEFDLEFGTYFYQEFDAPDGYEVEDTKYEFSITEDGKVISVIITNKKIPTETPKETPKEDTSEETPKKPSVSTESPKTGDESNVALWGIIAGVAALAGVSLVVVSFRKRNHKKGK